jgi:hypothetical protein
MALSTNTASWTQAQYKQATAADIAALTNDQVKALAHPDWLSPTAVAGFKASQITAISINWYYMSASWLNALSPAAFASIPAAGMVQLNRTAVAGLDAAHVKALSTTQINSVALRYFNSSAVAALSTSQIAAIATTTWSSFSAAWLNAIPADVFKTIPAAATAKFSSSAIAGLDVAHVKALTADQMRTLYYPEALSLTAVAQLSAAQVAAIPASYWYWISASWLNTLSGTAFAAIPASSIAQFSYSAYQGLSAARVAGMSNTQIAALAHADWLNTAAVAGLTATQVNAIATHWYWMSASWLNALSLPAFAALSATALKQLSSTALIGLDAKHIAALGTGQIAALSTAQIASLLPTQLAALNIAALSTAQLNALGTKIAGLSADAISKLSAAFIQQMSGTQLAALSVIQIAALLPAQLAVINVAGLSTAQLNALGSKLSSLSAGAISKLSTAFIQQLSATQLAALSTTQIAALTTAQLAVLNAGSLSVAQLNALGTKLANLSADAVSKLSVAFVQQMSTAQLAALSTTQIAKFTAAQIAVLSTTQASSLSSAQLAALGSNIQYMAAKSVASLSLSNLQLVYGSLTSTQLAGLSTDQLNALKQGSSTQSALLDSLTTAGIRNQVQAVLNAGQSLFTYNGLLKVLQAVDAVVGTQGLTQVQLNELKSLVTAVGKAVGTSSYLYEIASNVVNGCKSNATWTGGASTSTSLGNLAVGSSAWQMDKLIDKWFLGEDLPTWSSSAYTTINTPLYSVSGPLASDVTQGQIGDCYFMAALVNVASVESALIKSMITDNGNGTYGIRFYGANDDPVYITVNNQLPNSGRATSASGGSWVSLLEKAYVEYSVEVFGEANNYTSINGGWGEGLTAVTGKNCAYYYSYSAGNLQNWSTTIKNNVLNALSSGQEVMYASFLNVKDVANGKTDLVSGHMYSVLGYDRTKDELILRNPWGNSGGSSWNGVFDLTMSELWGGTSTATSARWSGFVVANEASPAGAISSAYKVNTSVEQLLQAMAADSSSSAASTTSLLTAQQTLQTTLVATAA